MSGTASSSAGGGPIWLFEFREAGRGGSLVGTFYYLKQTFRGVRSATGAGPPSGRSLKRRAAAPQDKRESLSRPVESWGERFSSIEGH